MKLLLIVFSAFAFCGVYSAPTDLELFSNPVDDLIHSALEYIRSLLKSHEPFPVPEMPVQTVKGDGVDLKAKFSDLKVSQASGFSIDRIENNVLQLKGSFAVTVPKMHLEGGYSLQGTVKGKAVKGSGNFKLDIDSLATSGSIQLGLVSNYLQMTQLDIDYDIKGLKFSEEGLAVEGMTQDQLADLFNNAFLNYFKTNKAFVASQVSDYVRGIANDIMKGKNLQQLLDWLKQFIHGFHYLNSEMLK